jgi:hypothetical protein
MKFHITPLASSFGRRAQGNGSERTVKPDPTLFGALLELTPAEARLTASARSSNASFGKPVSLVKPNWSGSRLRAPAKACWLIPEIEVRAPTKASGEHRLYFHLPA